MISVIIPLYNKEEHIEATLRSVLNQSFDNFEIVIVDDGSTDNSIRILERMNDPRIRLFKQTNQGVSAARNRGIKEACYVLVAFLDADDQWKSDYLQTQYELFLKYPQCSVFACNYEFEDASGKTLPTVSRKIPFDEVDGVLSNYFEVAVSSHPPLCSSAVMVRKTAILQIGGFPENIHSGEDLLTWAKLALCFQIAYSKSVAATYHFDMSSFNRNPRIPDDNDFVGNELKRLYENNKNIHYLRKYICRWYQIRASTYMRLFERKKIYAETLKSLEMSPLSLKSWIFLFLALFPLQLRLSILNR